MTLAEVLFCNQARIRDGIEQQISRISDRVFLASILGAKDTSSLEEIQEELREKWDSLSYLVKPESDTKPDFDERMREFIRASGIKHQQVKKSNA